MIITWIGHSCFKLTSGGCSLILDPYKDGSVPGLKPLRETACRVLCSHGHGDHSGTENVTLAPCEKDPFTVETIETWHDEAKGAKRGPNTIHIISDGEVRVAHMGDLGCALTEDEVRKLQGVDVLLLPIGGYYTIDARQAAQIVQQVMPKVTIPMHFRAGEGYEAPFGYDVIGTDEDFAPYAGTFSYIGSSIGFPSDVYEDTLFMTPVSAG